MRHQHSLLKPIPVVTSESTTTIPQPAIDEVIATSKNSKIVATKTVKKPIVQMQAQHSSVEKKTEIIPNGNGSKKAATPAKSNQKLRKTKGRHYKLVKVHKTLETQPPEIGEDGAVLVKAKQFYKIKSVSCYNLTPAKAEKLLHFKPKCSCYKLPTIVTKHVVEPRPRPSWLDIYLSGQRKMVQELKRDKTKTTADHQKQLKDMIMKIINEFEEWDKKNSYSIEDLAVLKRYNVMLLATMPLIAHCVSEFNGRDLLQTLVEEMLIDINDEIERFKMQIKINKSKNNEDSCNWTGLEEKRVEKTEQQQKEQKEKEKILARKYFRELVRKEERRARERAERKEDKEKRAEREKKKRLKSKDSYFRELCEQIANRERNQHIVERDNRNSAIQKTIKKLTTKREKQEIIDILRRIKRIKHNEASGKKTHKE